MICPAAVVDGSNRRQRLTDQDRIVGGQDVTPHSWPWIARLRIGSFLCGGTILGKMTLKRPKIISDIKMTTQL